MTPIGGAATHPTVGSPYSYVGGKTPRALHATSATISVPSTMPPYCPVASSSRLVRDARDTAAAAILDYAFPMGGRFVRRLVADSLLGKKRAQLFPAWRTMRLPRPGNWSSNLLPA